jgi:NitT/TauT family transport system permease protein/taurine transport system permease protein
MALERSSALEAAPLTRPLRDRGLRLLAGGSALKGTAGLLGLLLLWQLSVPLIGMSEYFYPSPLRVMESFVELTAKGILPVYLFDSFVRYVGGVTIGASLGLALGVAIGLSPFLSRLLGPFINFLYAIVEGAWVPLFVVWWGYGLKVVMVLLVYIIFFPMLYNTMVGVRTVPQVYVNAVRALGASRWRVLVEVILPAALPSIITGFRVGAGFAFRGLIFAEMIAATSGIGYLIYQGASSQDTARTIVGMICTGLMWLFIDNCYLKPFERATIERWGVVAKDER